MTPPVMSAILHAERGELLFVGLGRQGVKPILQAITGARLKGLRVQALAWISIGIVDSLHPLFMRAQLKQDRPGIAVQHD